MSGINCPSKVVLLSTKNDFSKNTKIKNETYEGEFDNKMTKNPNNNSKQS